MTCSRCQHENPRGQKFCGECGAHLAAACPSCGVANPPGQKFCGDCGTALAPNASKSASPASYTPRHLADRILTSRAMLEGERKLVTVLFADIKSSMELLANRDPEEARELLDPVLERMLPDAWLATMTEMHLNRALDRQRGVRARDRGRRQPVRQCHRRHPHGARVLQTGVAGISPGGPGHSQALRLRGGAHGHSPGGGGGQVPRRGHGPPGSRSRLRADRPHGRPRGPRRQPRRGHPARQRLSGGGGRQGLVKRAAEAEGFHEIFTAAGFEWREPGCSMCVGINGNTAREGERVASTSNRNFEGRQGQGARTHLMSPAMAAAAAVASRLTDVRSLLGASPSGERRG